MATRPLVAALAFVGAFIATAGVDFGIGVLARASLSPVQFAIFSTFLSGLGVFSVIAVAYPLWLTVKVSQASGIPSRVSREFAVASFGVAVLVILSVVGFSVSFRHPLSAVGATRVIAIYAVAVSILGVGYLLRSVLQGVGEIGLVAHSNIIEGLLKAAFVSGAILLFVDPIIAAAAVIFAGFAGAILALVFVSRRGWRPSISGATNWSHHREVVEFGMALISVRLLVFLSGWTFAPLAITPAAIATLGDIQFAETLARLPLMLGMSVTIGLLPYLAKEVAGSTRPIHSAISKLIWYALGAGIVVLYIVYDTNLLVRIPIIMGSAPYLPILGVMSLAMTAATYQGTMLATAGLSRGVLAISVPVFLCTAAVAAVAFRAQGVFAGLLSVAFGAFAQVGGLLLISRNSGLIGITSRHVYAVASGTAVGLIAYKLITLVWLNS